VARAKEEAAEGKMGHAAEAYFNAAFQLDACLAKLYS
jgi:hypothetical protein